MLLLLLLACFPAALSAEDRQPSDPSWSVNSSFSSRYVYRTATDPASDTRWTDKDVFADLRIDAVSPKENQYEFHFFGTVRGDLSDNRDTTGFYPLEDIGDSYRTGTHGYLYEAHLDMNNLLSSLKQVRIGRQAGQRDEPLFFDGLAVDVAATRSLNLSLYGGAAVHLYESGGHWGDDALAGAGVDYAPFTRTRLSLDYLAVNDKHTAADGTELEDRMASIRLWQGFGSSLKSSLKYRYLNREPRDASLRVQTVFPDPGTEIDLGYFRQFRIQNELSNELSQFYAVLGRSSPYQSYDAKARSLLGKYVAVDLGHFKRSLIEEVQATAFDRNYSRSFLAFELLDLPFDGMSFTLTGEQWNAAGRDYHTAGFDMGYSTKRRAKARVNAGTYYSLYKYDYYLEEGLREKVRTYYVNGRFPVTSGLSVNFGYEYEKGIELYQTGKLGLRYDF